MIRIKIFTLFCIALVLMAHTRHNPSTNVHREPAQNCTTNAGYFFALNTTWLCVPQTYGIPTSLPIFHYDLVLDSNDVISFILYTDPNNPLGSILTIGTNLYFQFDPGTMQTGTPYYYTVIAGNNLNGLVDLNDPCISTCIYDYAVVWNTKPSVTFSVDNPTLCGGECRTVTANFTGREPFSLTYSTPSGVSTQVFGSTTGTFQVCAPANAPSGNLQVQALSLTDFWCNCQ
jgi:hypothetical protein